MRRGSRIVWFLCTWHLTLAFFSLSGILEVARSAENQVSYAGKSVRLIVPVPPGGALDLQSRVLAPLLRNYIPGNPSVVVQNMPGAGGIAAANHLPAVATPELTILQCHIGHPLYQVMGREVKYDVRNWRFLGGAKRPFMPIVQRADLPYRSVSEWRQAKDPIIWAAGTLGGTPENPAQIMRLAGARLKIVTGYLGSASRLVAVLRGEADAAPETLATAKPHLDAGKLKVVGRLIPAEIPGYPDAPYVLKAFPFTEEQRILYGVAEAPWHLQTCWVVRQDTPKAAVQVLQEAVKRAILSPEYNSTMDRMQLGAEYMAPDEILEKFVKPQLGITADLQEKFRKIVLTTE